MYFISLLVFILPKGDIVIKISFFVTLYLENWYLLITFSNNI
jgi:hypothetical protein